MHKLNPTLLNVILYDDEALKDISKFFNQNDTETISVWITEDWQVVMQSEDELLYIEEYAWRPDHEA